MWVGLRKTNSLQAIWEDDTRYEDTELKNIQIIMNDPAVAFIVQKGGFNDRPEHDENHFLCQVAIPGFTPPENTRNIGILRDGR